MLTEILWPDQDDGTTDRFRQALSAIRRALEPAGGGMVGVVIADRAEVGLSKTAVTTDVAEFEAALKAAERAASPEERVVHLEQALTTYGGELLPGIHDDSILSERERLEEACLQALGRAAETLEQMGNLRGHRARSSSGPDRPAARGSAGSAYPSLLEGRAAGRRGCDTTRNWSGCCGRNWAYPPQPRRERS